MEKILDFLSENYIWFFVAAGVLLFALIGYIVQSKKKDVKKEENLTEVPSTETVVADIPNVETPQVEPIMVNEQVSPEVVAEPTSVNDIPLEISEVQPEITPSVVETPEVIETIDLGPVEPVVSEVNPIHDLNLETPVETTEEETPIVIEMDDSNNTPVI